MADNLGRRGAGNVSPPELRGLQVVHSYLSAAEPKTELTQLPRRFLGAAAVAAAAAWSSLRGRDRNIHP